LITIPAKKCCIGDQDVALDRRSPQVASLSTYNVGFPEPRQSVATQQALAAVGQYALIIKPFLKLDLLSALETATRRRS
jgi:hypothetical protein